MLSRRQKSTSWSHSSSRRHWLLLVIFLTSAAVTTTTIRVADAQAYQENDEYVRQVLEEEQEHYGGEYDDAYGYHHYEDEDRIRQTEEERRAQEQAERIARERDAQFEKELAKMNEDQRKKALKQKKKDSKIVRSVLKAAEKGQHYTVLGIRNWNLRIPPREYSVAGKTIKIPGITLKHTSTKDIKKAFRNRSKVVHPDKNKDGHAQEAFIAVETSASILTDENARRQYDQELKVLRQQQQQMVIALVGDVLDSIKKALGNFVWLFKSVLGPFALPVAILLALII